MNEDTGEEDGGAWLSAVIIKKICMTTQGNIGNGKYIIYNKDTYIIKYDDDCYYDINRPTCMIRRRTENVAEAEDYSDPQDPFPPLCFITLPGIGQCKEEEEYVDEKNRYYSEEEEKEEEVDDEEYHMDL